ncbi:Ig-like domain-containing protein [candidate division KSB1 bacterium]|nr:Ig-like domain-containing protein [candidate division KSB1 bacterium]
MAPKEKEKKKENEGMDWSASATRLKRWGIGTLGLLTLLASGTAASIPENRFFAESVPENTETRVWQGKHISFSALDLEEITPESVQVDTSLGDTKSSQTEGLSLRFPLRWSEGRVVLGRLTARIAPQAIVDPATPVTARLHIVSPQADSIPDSLLYAEMDDDGILSFLLPGIEADELSLSFENIRSSGDAVQFALEEMNFSAARRIMLVGDSITKGTGSTDDIGFRKILYQTLIGEGYDIDFVGDTGEPPYEGHFEGGRKISDFFPLTLGNGGTGRMDITYHMTSYRPDIVAILLGTNDILSDYYPPAPYVNDTTFALTLSGQMATLVNYLLKWRNGEKGDFLQSIIVSLDIPVSYHDSLCIAFNADVSRMIRDFRSGRITGREEPVFECDHYTRFQEDPFLWFRDGRGLMYDHYHPNDRGHARIAATYAQTLVEWMEGRPRWFSDRSWQYEIAGSDIHMGSQGIAVADFSDDGRPDLYISRIAPESPDEREYVYINQDGAFFTEEAQSREITDPGQSRGLLWVDIDNDGDWDLYNAQTLGPNRLYRNNGLGLFSDITLSAGIVDLGQVTTTTVLALDAENDGDMDLYAVNSRHPNEMYINQGTGQFSRQNRGADDVLEPNIPSISAAAADFDQDGDIDIYVVKRGGANRLYVNQGDGTFLDQASSAGVALNQQSNSAVWADLDNDGDLDLLVGQSSTTGGAVLLRVFQNNGDRTFSDRSSTLNIYMDGYSVLAADFDNDGWLDILTTGDMVSGELYRNLGDWSFRLESNSGAEIIGGDVRGAAVVDIDQDGDLDVIAARADAFNTFLVNNLDNDNHYLQVDARGPQNNRGGFGTKIWIYRSGEFGNPAALLGYREVVSASGHQSQSSSVQHFGLGSHLACDLLAHFTDGTVVIQRQIPADQQVLLRPEFPGGGGDPVALLQVSGDNQAACVGERLPNPVSVQAVDAVNRPVAGARVDFNIESGSAQILLPSIDPSTLGFEAETGVTGGSALWAFDLNSSGNGLVFVPALASGNGLLEKTLSLEQAASYYIWIRAAHSAANAEIQLQVDGGTAFSFPVDSYQTWSWYRVQSAGIPKLFDLSAGTRTCRLTLPPATMVDRVLFTVDPDDIPTGTGGTGLDPLLTDGAGIASRLVQLGSEAGLVQIRTQLFHNNQPVNGQSVLFNLTAQPGEPVSFTVSGDQQIGQVGEPLAQPFAVRIFDAFGNGIPSLPVTFQVISGGGMLQPDGTVLTDYRGSAQTLLTPGDAESRQQVRATMDRVPGSPYVFRATVSGLASTLLRVSGDQQSDVVGRLLADPLRVRVMVSETEPAPSYPVTFRIESGGGLLQSSIVASQPEIHTQATSSDSTLTLITDADGYAQIYWRLGFQAGVQRLSALASGLSGSPALFRAQALADRPSQIFAFSGNEQSGPIMQVLPQDLFVRVVDDHNNPVAGHSVSFTSLTAGGIFPSSGNSNLQVQTDSSGYARAAYRLGTMIGENVYRIEAISHYSGTPLNGSPVAFYASGNAGQATRAYKLWTEGQCDTVGTTLAEAVRVKITDAFQNSVANYPVVFAVVDGNGKVDGQDQVTKTTDSQGIARAFFRLGTTAGQSNQVVEARMPGLEPTTLQFTASACASAPHRMEELSGNGQTAPVNFTLSAPFAVRISDYYGNPVSDHRVVYRVTSPEGHFSGSRVVDRFSDSAGLATARLTLGSQVGDSLYRAQAESFYRQIELQSSPVTFFASALFAHPVRLIPITDGSLILGAAFRELDEPLTVKVVDNDDVGVPGIPVQFSVIAGGGTFLPDRQVGIEVLTDSQGLAQARWVLGAALESQMVRVAVVFNGAHLVNSPHTFTAVAVATQPDRLIKVSGDDQQGVVGENLPQDFVVRVVDTIDLPVGNHPVHFQVVEGDAVFLENGSASQVVYTTEEGSAAARLTLGSAAGTDVYRIRVSSIDNFGSELEDSPQYFLCSAVPDQPDWDRSELTVTTPVPATGTAFSTLQVRLLDSFGNPVPDRLVRFHALSAVVIKGGEGLTDSQGLFSATANSTLPGVYTVRCQDVSSGMWLSRTAEVEFIASSAARIALSSGQNQVGYPHSQLAHPLQIAVFDGQGNTAAGYPVDFSADSTRVQFLTPLPVWSDTHGIAQVSVLIGDRTGSAFVRALAPGLLGSPVDFGLEVVEPGDFNLIALTPLEIVGLASQDSVVDVEVQCVDGQNRPIGNQALYFSVDQPEKASVDSLYHRSRYDGRTTARIRFGNRTGQTQLQITDAAGMVKLVFTIQVQPSSAQKIEVDAGDRQQGIVGRQLARSLVVRVTDRFGNGVEGAQVSFTVVQGNGTLIGDAGAITDAAGRASIDYQLGFQRGEQLIEAQTNLLPDNKAQFVCLALPDQPAALARAGGNQQTGIAGHLLSQRIAVQINDRYGNGVPGTPVFFNRNGTDSRLIPSEIAISDSLGIARIGWILGSQAGQQFLAAVRDGLQNSPLLFTAFAQPNNPPVILVADSVRINESETLDLEIRVTDLDQDPVTVQAADLPSGAVFESLRLSWTPNYDQAGVHSIRFTARDSAGAESKKELLIRVDNANRKPQIIEDLTLPQQRDLGTVKSWRGVDFLVTAVDPDDDPIRFIWTVNEKIAATSAAFRFEGQVQDPGETRVEALVFDPYDTTRVFWTFRLITPVELSAFSGRFVPFSGIELDWKTRAAAQTRGFYVLRAKQKNGPFERISDLIPVNAQGSYNFADRDVESEQSHIHYYRLRDVQLSGAENDHQMISVDPVLPDEFRLYPNHPNPFNPETSIRFQLAEPGSVRLTIVDLMGRQVAVLVDQERTAGFYRETWNGCNDGGDAVASGVYFAVLVSRQERASHKMILLR